MAEVAKLRLLNAQVPPNRLRNCPAGRGASSPLVNPDLRNTSVSLVRCAASGTLALREVILDQFLKMNFQFQISDNQRQRTQT